MKKYLARLLKKRNSAGFTLVEVIVSTALLGVLMVGVVLFMAPVFSMVDTNETAQRADRTATTLEHYISKSLRNTVYVKVYTGVVADDIEKPDGAIREDEDFLEIVEYMKNHSDNYQLNCLSIKYVEDTNPRNSSEGNHPHKFMLYNESFDNNYQIISSEPVFEECFYEDIYPKFTFDREAMKIEIDADGNIIDPTPTPDSTTEADPDETAEAEPEAKTTLYSGVKLDIDIYDDESLMAYAHIFKGTSYIEINNIKSMELNSEGKYKVYPTLEIDPDEKDMYIFYVSRKLGTFSGFKGDEGAES
ncbi:MAG: prepilin-type N-terminal cleavage/methylation domain-containing protein [Ruminococcaceae bacterium]|nr:prepilin-type N-terminal cleavage/methylation domain-containing protein [Oscillospiraceae bacterium]MBE6902044.1 prepilin-type N-terminal cleavage/methylation domain-containing protein [Oscillospiraceae bacterium]